MSDYLVGKTINKMMIASDKKAILFITPNEEVKAKIDGDCCSESWIEHVEILTTFPSTVISVEDIDMPEPDQSDFECLQSYGCKITTDKGTILIEYRNESNGYYGGNIIWPDENDWFYGGVFGQNISTEEWIELNEDI